MYDFGYPSFSSLPSYGSSIPIPSHPTFSRPNGTKKPHEQTAHPEQTRACRLSPTRTRCGVPGPPCLSRCPPRPAVAQSAGPPPPASRRLRAAGAAPSHPEPGGRGGGTGGWALKSRDGRGLRERPRADRPSPDGAQRRKGKALLPTTPRATAHFRRRQRCLMGSVVRRGRGPRVPPGSARPPAPANGRRGRAPRGSVGRPGRSLRCALAAGGGPGGARGGGGALWGQALGHGPPGAAPGAGPGETRHPLRYPPSPTPIRAPGQGLGWDFA